MPDVPRVGNGGLRDISGSSSATFTGTWKLCYIHDDIDRVVIWETQSSPKLLAGEGGLP